MSCTYTHTHTVCIRICICILCNDISLNPGPASVVCPKCLKNIRKNQSRTDCAHCREVFHLRSLCSTASNLLSELELSNAELLLLLSVLKDIVKSRGPKIIHTNIRSLFGKIDELRLLISELHSGIHLLALTKTWADNQITDAELAIPGYQLFRRDFKC